MDEIIRTLREHHGWTLRDLAERCGVTRQAVSQWVAGQAHPTVAVGWRLVALGRAAGYDWTLEDIYPPPTDTESAA